METKLQQLTVDERIKLVEDLWDNIAADQTRAHFRLPPIRERNSTAVNAYAVDKNRGHPAADAVRDICRQL